MATAQVLAQVIPLVRPGTPREQVPTKHEPYNLDPAFERGLVCALACRPKLWATVGSHMDPEALAQPSAKLCLETIAAIVAETDRAPERAREVLQRLARMQDDGRVTYDARMAVRAMFEAELEDDPPTDQGLIDQMRPILQARLRKQAIRIGISELAKNTDMVEVADTIAKANAIGASDFSEPVTQVGVESVDVLEESPERLSTGMMELDDALEGGATVGTESVWLAAPFGGKSAGLVQIGVAASLLGRSVAYFTLEIPPKTVHARALANLLGVPINACLYKAGGEWAHIAKRLKAMGAWLTERLKLYVQKLPAKLTSVGDVVRHVAAMEERQEERIDVVIVDYADLLRPDRAVAKDDKGYIAAGDVYEGLRRYADDTKRWVWTASQATRGNGKRKLLDLDDVADSMGKVRVADAVISINPEDERAEQVSLYTAKDRGSKGRVVVGPLPTDFACARLAPVNPTLYACPA